MTTQTHLESKLERLRLAVDIQANNQQIIALAVKNLVERAGDMPQFVEALDHIVNPPANPIAEALKKGEERLRQLGRR